MRLLNITPRTKIYTCVCIIDYNNTKSYNLDGNTLTHLAALHENMDLLIYLTTFVTNIHLYNKKRETPLAVAVLNRKLRACKYLYETRYKPKSNFKQ